jgi:plastocyanin
MVGMRRLTLAAATAALATAVAAGSVLAADTEVTIAGFAFDPTTVTIDVGDAVTWTNNDSTAHNATADDGSNCCTQNIAAGESMSITFLVAGTYPYHCTIHQTMHGTVVVEAAAATPAPTPEPTIGEGVSITPAPTDTLAATADEDLVTSAVAIALATLGALMLVGTFVADRRFRERRGEK